MGNVTLFAKLLPFPAVTIISGRALFSVLILGLFFWIRGKSVSYRSFKDFSFVFGIGILFALHWVTYFHSIQVSTVAVGMLSLFTYPVFSAILEPMFGGKRPDPFAFFLACFSFFGLFLIVPDLSWDNQMFQGVVWGVVSAVLYAIRNLLTKEMHVHYPSAQILFTQLIATSLVLLPFADGLFVMLAEPKYLVFQVVLAGVFTSLAHTIWIRSLSNLSVTTAGTLSTLSPIYGSLAAWYFLGEVPPDRLWLGGGVILFCAILEVFRKQAESGKREEEKLI
ncbi:DMT family transporter [Leptospira bandrabouensis]|uniref:EamA/RhaT family transporter n=1 Tax=Leptospira bandrabouensis TaxID=2484903 RepID=A0A6H3NJP6_9LEPT|nr:DMT family transporter [Leptospira bandrabouensis]MCG6153699.1 DMT family transporter [Leptospira bandrabouensis]MCW7457980.1 DMT family transporter [Leptospira bandrabouensis]MCW7479109.1 DMT family transporter [Leptospira bandrabouensis]MCW7486763.1 DMT family transporter [Leptospira bandrabouensis]TGN08980.1 EamA/RhaT family transporter [Leptospira bandrabouensis]